jgi:uncharacterized protein (TIGR00255 family)
MTGYGRGTCEVSGRRLVIELRSLNHRFLEVKLRLPWNDPAIDMHVTQALRGKLDRGVVTVSVRDEGGGLPQAVRADVELARGYAKALEEVRVALSLPEPVSLALVAAQPGVISVGEGLPDSDALWIALKPGLEQAVAALVEARAREGAALTEDLRVRLSSMEKFAADLRELTRDSPDLYRKRLQERLERALGVSTGDERLPAIVDPARLAQEVAILADKVDITEELTRLQAHLAEFRRLLSDGGAVGRRLDFLTQEVNREINTIGSKSQSGPAAARVVDAKAELERFREQIQNVE